MLLLGDRVVLIVRAERLEILICYRRLVRGSARHDMRGCLAIVVEIIL
jgi:hypothetical protein